MGAASLATHHTASGLLLDLETLTVTDRGLLSLLKVDHCLDLVKVGRSWDLLKVDRGFVNREMAGMSFQKIAVQTGFQVRGYKSCQIERRMVSGHTTELLLTEALNDAPGLSGQA